MSVVQGFLPSRHGFQFDNAFPQGQHFHLDLLVARVPIGDAANGLCGGMCFAVTDYFLAGQLPPQLSRPPGPGSPLYAHIVGRLWQSFDLPHGPAKYLAAMNPVVPLESLWRELVDREWPAVRDSIDRGVPATLNLVQVRSSNPAELGRNHQVLVFGYNITGNEVTLNIYDPNFGFDDPRRGDRDGRILVFDLTDASAGVRYHPTRDGVDLFHAFYSPYRSAAPPGPGAERVDGWEGWTPRAALPDARAAAGDPMLASNADGRGEIFVRTDGGAIFHCWQLSPLGGWSPWRSFDGTLLGDPAVVATANGRLMVLGRGLDGNIWHRTQTAASNGWPPFWTPIAPGSFTGDPVAARNGDGRIEVFARGEDGAVWHVWQTAPDGDWAEHWEQLGELRVDDRITVATNADGALELFVIGANGNAWHCWQPTASQGWSGWEDLGGPHRGRPAAAANLDGRLEVFARGADGGIGRRWQAGGPRGAWSPPWWEATGKPGSVMLEGRTVPAIDRAGRMNVFVRGEDDRLYVRRQDSPGGWFDPWMDLQTDQVSGDPAVGSEADGRLLLAARRQGQVWLDRHGA